MSRLAANPSVVTRKCRLATACTTRQRGLSIVPALALVVSILVISAGAAHAGQGAPIIGYKFESEKLIDTEAGLGEKARPSITAPGLDIGPLTYGVDEDAVGSSGARLVRAVEEGIDEAGYSDHVALLDPGWEEVWSFTVTNKSEYTWQWTEAEVRAAKRSERDPRRSIGARIYSDAGDDSLPLSDPDYDRGYGSSFPGDDWPLLDEHDIEWGWKDTRTVTLELGDLGPIEPGETYRIVLAFSGHAHTRGYMDSFVLRGRPLEATSAEMTITEQPTQTWAPEQGERIDPAPTVQITDAAGKPLPAQEVSARLAEGSFAEGSTTTVISDDKGMARFDDLLISEAADDERIIFSVEGVGDVHSDPFHARALTDPDSLTFDRAPERLWTSEVPTRLIPAPRVKATLDDGTPVPYVEVAVRAEPDVLDGDSTTTARTDLDGIARFDDLHVREAGEGYRLIFDAPRASTLRSEAFEVEQVAHAPRIMVDAGRIAGIREAATEAGSHHAEAIEAMKQRIEQGASAYRPGFHEDDENYFNSWLAREAALAYLLTDDVDYAETALEALRALPDAGSDQGSGLARAQRSVAFAFAYDWAGMGWDEDERQWARDQMNEALDAWPDFSHTNLGHPRGSNWVAVVRGAELILLIAAGEEEARADRLDSLVSDLRQHINVGYGSLGYTQEGLGYKNYGASFLFPAALVLEDVVGDGALADPIRGMESWRMAMYGASFGYGSIDEHRRKMPYYPQSGVSNPYFYEEGLTSLLWGFVSRADAPYYKHFYDRITGVKSPLEPGYKYDPHRAATTWAVLLYPLDVESRDPSGGWPAAVEDTRGYYWYRNRWQDENDTLGLLMADTNHHPRAWNQPEALAISLYSKGTLFFGGPGRGRDATDFTSINVDGERPTGNPTGERVSFETEDDTAYIVVGGGAAYREVGLDRIRRHLKVDFTGRSGTDALFSSLDRFEADGERTITWHANLSPEWQPQMKVEVIEESGRPAFVLRRDDNPDAYLKGWVLHPADAEVEGDSDSLKISTEKRDGDIWVVWTTGDGDPVTADIERRGLESRLIVGDAVIEFDGEAERVRSRDR